MNKLESIIIAAIGAGGKTSTLKALARHLQERSVLFTTTTHIFPLDAAECRAFLPDPQPCQLLEELRSPGVICTGSTAKLGKLSALPAPLLDQAMDAAEVTLYEADGANRLPLKLHRKGEPVVLPRTDRCVIVAGLSALGRPVSEVVHRFQLEPEWAADPDCPADAQVFLRCIRDAVKTADLPRNRFRILLNQADTLRSPREADSILAALQSEGLICRLGSLARSPELLPAWVLED